jgi:MFS family permease
MLRNIVAVVCGFAAGCALNMAIIQFNMHVLYPMPAGMDMNEAKQFNAFIATLPTAAFLVVMVAHLGQSFVGGALAARMGASRPMLLAMIVGLLSLAGGIMAMMMIDGPDWMAVELPLYLVVAWFAGRLEEKRRALSSAVPSDGD